MTDKTTQPVPLETPDSGHSVESQSGAAAALPTSKVDRDTLDLGDDHTLTFCGYRGEKRVGASIAHKKPDGSDCDGWIAFADRAWAKAFAAASIATWTVEADEPLTLSPSVLCRSCGDHGYVRAGRWVKA